MFYQTIIFASKRFRSSLGKSNYEQNEKRPRGKHNNPIRDGANFYCFIQYLDLLFLNQFHHDDNPLILALALF